MDCGSFSLPETISELVRKQKEQQTKREVTEDIVMTETSATQKQDNSEVEEVLKTSSIIPNPLTPPTPDSLTKDKTQVKVEALPVSSCGMMDRTRVALFAFMFTFLFINPLSYVFPQLDKGTLLIFSCRRKYCHQKVLKVPPFLNPFSF